MLLMFAIDSLCCLYRACFSGIESGVEETSVTLADNHSTKNMDSDALMLSMSYGSLRGSSAVRMVITQAYKIICHHMNPLGVIYYT